MRRFGVGAMTVVVTLALTGLPREAAALDIDNILIVQGSHRTDGTPDTNGFFFVVEVNGTGILNGRIVQETMGEVPTGRQFTLSNGGDWDYDNSFSSWAQMVSIHPNPTIYHFYFNEGHGDADQVRVSIAIAPPSGYATITYPLHDATGVATNPTYLWDNVEAYGDVQGRFVLGSDDIYSELDNNIAQTSWQPGPLDTGKEYGVRIAVGRQTGGSKPLVLHMHQDPNDWFTYHGIVAYCNKNDFTTVPEPGTIALFGTAMLILIGLRRRYRLR